MQVNSIFRSISGEVGVIPQGAVTWFIRMQGCSLNCAWCDTNYAQGFDIGDEMEALQIAEQIPELSNVVITGGEPLEQDAIELSDLVSLLVVKGCSTQIETNGTTPPFLPVCHVFDYKTPSSGKAKEMMADKYFGMGPEDSWVKFVVKDGRDLEFSIGKILQARWPVRWALSVPNGYAVQESIKYIEKRCSWLLPHIVFNFQLHKTFELP